MHGVSLESWAGGMQLDQETIERLERSARQALRESLGTEDDPFGATYYLNWHIENLAPGYWELLAGTSRPRPEEALEHLRLGSRWVPGGVFASGDEFRGCCLMFMLPDVSSHREVRVGFDSNFEVETLEASVVLTYEEWLDSLFERRGLSFDTGVIDHRTGGIPTWFFAHLARFFRESGELHAELGTRELSRALWEILKGELNFELWNSYLPLQPRLDCFEAMEDLYREVFSKGEMAELCHMWWDIIILRDPEEQPTTYRVVLDVLRRILVAGPLECSGAALHGLGHLNTPGRAEVIDAWLETRDDLDAETVAYAQAAREGKVL
jgi:hypothetical protein